MKRVAALLALLFAAVACGEPAPDSGQVIDTDFTPSHYRIYETSHCGAYGTQQTYRTDSKGRTTTSTRSVCLYYVTDVHHDFVADRWSIRIRGRNKNNKIVEAWITVDRYVYTNCRQGRQYPECGAR